MRVFLTGANGFLGAAIAACLAEGGDDLICLVRPQSDCWRLKGVPGKLMLVRADIQDKDAMRHLLAEVAPHAVCHAAWQGVQSADRNDPAQDSNIAATGMLARLAAEMGGGIFLGIGSQAEYGPLNRIAHEDDPLSPTTRYGMAKVAACREAAAACELRGLRFAWLRVFSLYGPKDHESWLLPHVIRTLLKNERPALTAAEQHWDFLHVGDAAQAVRRVLRAQAAGIFNLGSGKAHPLREVIEEVRDLIDPKLALGFGEIGYRPDQTMWLQADISRLQALGWQPRTSLGDGLRETIAWFRGS